MMSKAFEISLFSLLFLPTDLGMAEAFFRVNVLLKTSLIMWNEIQLRLDGLWRYSNLAFERKYPMIGCFPLLYLAIRT